MDPIVVTAPRYRQISDRGLKAIMKSERLRLLAYDDFQPKRTRWSCVSQIKGTPTIGFGHIRTVSKADVVNGKRITKEQAYELKRADLQMVYGQIEKAIGRERVWELSDNQYAALVSFVFNLGINPKWTITKRLKAGRFDDVPAQMQRFVYSKGVRLQGLVNRRREEADLWLEDDTVAGTAAAHADVEVEEAPMTDLGTSRTIKASMLAGLSALGAGSTAALPMLVPHAGDSDVLHVLMVVCTTVSALSAFAAAAFRADDKRGAA